MFKTFIVLLLFLPLSGFAYAPHLDSRRFYLHTVSDDELGNFRWGNFLTCLKTVSFENDPGPRELNMKYSRLVITEINTHTWIFSIKEDETSVILESITIDTHKYYSLREKRQLFLKIVANCDTKKIKD